MQSNAVRVNIMRSYLTARLLASGARANILGMRTGPIAAYRLSWAKGIHSENLK